MGKSLLTWTLLSAIGAGIIALPDSGRRLVSFSAAHGPSSLDAAGMLVLLLGWLIFALALWQRRDRLGRRLASSQGLVVVFALGLGTGLVVASVAGDYPYWWVIGVGALLAGQILGAYLARS